MQYLPRAGFNKKLPEVPSVITALWFLPNFPTFLYLNTDFIKFNYEMKTQKKMEKRKRKIQRKGNDFQLFSVQ